MEDLFKVALAIIMVTGFPLLFYAGFVGIRVFQRRMDGRSGGQETLHELEDLRARVAELEQVQSRVAELEERVDFSERVLTQAKPAGQPKPQGGEGSYGPR